MMSLDWLVGETNRLTEERQMLMAAERLLSRREQRLEAMLAEAGGGPRAAEALRRVAERRRGEAMPEEVMKRLCCPGFVYATAYSEDLAEEVFGTGGV